GDRSPDRPGRTLPRSGGRLLDGFLRRAHAFAGSLYISGNAFEVTDGHPIPYAHLFEVADVRAGLNRCEITGGVAQGDPPAGQIDRRYGAGDFAQLAAGERVRALVCAPRAREDRNEEDER